MLHLCGDTDLLMPFLFYTVLPRLCFSGLAPLVRFIALAYLALIKLYFRCLTHLGTAFMYMLYQQWRPHFCFSLWLLLTRFLYNRCKVSDFFRRRLCLLWEKTMCYDILTERRAGVLWFKKPSWPQTHPDLKPILTFPKGRNWLLCLIDLAPT